MKQRRFIAGAVCPQCQLMDKLMVYGENDQEFCECVRCGYKIQQETEAQPVMAVVGKKEHIIRVNRPKKREH